MVGDEKEDCVWFQVKKRNYFSLYHGEAWPRKKWNGIQLFFCSSTIPSSVVGHGDLAISRRIKLETGGAGVPKTQK